MVARAGNLAVKLQTSTYQSLSLIMIGLGRGGQARIRNRALETLTLKYQLNHVF